MHDLPLARVYRTTEELKEPEVAEVVGTIPSWIQGTFVRAGPGVFDLKNSFQMNHYLDGYCILSKFEINGSEIKFYKKFLESDAFMKAKISGKPTVCELGTRGYPDTTKGFFTRYLPTIIPPLSDNCNMCAFKLGNKYFAASETSFIREFDLTTLNTGEKYDSIKYFGLNTTSCHPLTDEETGYTYNIGPSFCTGLKYNIIRIPPLLTNQTPHEIFKKTKIIATIPSSWNGVLSFNHSFAMTKNYIVLIEQPYVLVASRILSGILTRNQSVLDWLEWRKDLKNNFLIVEKSTGKLIKTEFMTSDPFFFLHVINAYEDNNNIVVDISIFPDPSVILNLTVDILRSGKFYEEKHPEGVRFVLPMINIQENSFDEGVNLIFGIKTLAKGIKNGSKIILSPEILTPRGLEMPTINKNYIGRKYNYYYATGSATNGIFRNSILKVDTTDHKIIKWQKSKSYYVGEPVFIQSPNPVSEDDGVILSAVTTDGSEEDNGHDDKSISPSSKDFLLILDGKSLEEISRAYINTHLPQGVHGIFVPN